jgi:hypothetical protein
VMALVFKTGGQVTLGTWASAASSPAGFVYCAEIWDRIVGTGSGRLRGNPQNDSEPEVGFWGSNVNSSDHEVQLTRRVLHGSRVAAFERKFYTLSGPRAEGSRL